MEKELNIKLKNKLDKKYYGKIKLIPYSNCCGSCLGNKFDDENRNKYKLLARLYLEGMNYDDMVRNIFVCWNDIEVSELKEYADPILKEYLRTLGVKGTIIYPTDSSEAIHLKLDHPLSLENEYDDDEDW